MASSFDSNMSGDRDIGIYSILSNNNCRFIYGPMASDLTNIVTYAYSNQGVEEQRGFSIVTTSGVLSEVMNQIGTRFYLKRLVDQREIEIYVDDVPDDRLLVTDVSAYSLFTDENVVFELDQSEYNVDKLVSHIDDSLMVANKPNIDYIGLSEIREKVGEYIDPSARPELTNVIETGESYTPSNTKVETVIAEILLLLGAKHHTTYPRIRHLCAELDISSSPTLTRIKSRLEENGIITTKTMLQDNGRPPQELILDESHNDIADTVFRS